MSIKLGLRQRDSLMGIAFALPFLAGFTVFYVAPLCICLIYTFTYGTGGFGQFVGLKNYKEVLGSPSFQIAATNTIRFILIAVPLIMAFSLMLALFLHKAFKGSSFYRSAFLFPLVVPAASTVMTFSIVFDELGILNTIFAKLNLPIQDWLHSPYAFWVLVALYIWKNAGYNMVLFMAGLNSIPRDFYEFAELEGAGKWKSFWHITMPLLAPTSFFVFVISIVNSFKCFREAYLLCGSIPHESIYMLQHYMNNNFANLNYQRLSVAALMVFLIIFIMVGILYIRRRKAGDITL